MRRRPAPVTEAQCARNELMKQRTAPVTVKWSSVRTKDSVLATGLNERPVSTLQVDHTLVGIIAVGPPL
jgi:hypothetical protein